MAMHLIYFISEVRQGNRRVEDALQDCRKVKAFKDHHFHLKELQPGHLPQLQTTINDMVYIPSRHGPKPASASRSQLFGGQGFGFLDF